MGILACIALCIFILYLQCQLSDRVKKCERLLKELQVSPPIEEAKSAEQPVVTAKLPPPAPFSVPAERPREVFTEMGAFKSVPKAEKTIKAHPSNDDRAEFKKQSRKSFQIPAVIKENWMGLFGSIALVIGAVFFGLTSEIMKLAEARVSLMIIFSTLLLVISRRIKRQDVWISLCGWLNSIGGAIILFATLGAGGIEGLQFIHSPIYALSFLCLGIAINISLAMTTPFQAVASLHVVLSLMAFCLAPQGFILLPIGALVACMGLIAAYRSKWDFHLLAIVMAFAFQNTVWTYTLENELMPWMHYLALACSLLVGIVAAVIHYSKKYESPKLELLPLVAHISNFGLLIWNIWLHASFFKGTPLILAVVAMAGFFCARVARKKGIGWLYNTDTLLAQGVGIAAILSLSTFSVGHLDLAILVLLETMLFSIVCRRQNDHFLLKVSYIFQSIGYLAAAYFTLMELNFDHYDALAINLRMGTVLVLGWAVYGVNAKNIVELYVVNNILAQGMRIAAILSLRVFSVGYFDLALLVLLENMLFCYICRRQKEKFLLQVGYIIQSLTYLVTTIFAFKELNAHDDDLTIYLRMGMFVIISWGIYVRRGFFVDDLEFIITGGRDSKNPISLTAMFGTLFLLTAYFFGFNIVAIQCLVMCVILAMGYWRKVKEDPSCNLSFILSLTCLHLFQWFHLMALIRTGETLALFTRWDIWALVFMDALLIYGNFLQFNLPKRKNIARYLVYASGMQMGLLLYVFTYKMSLLIPGLAYLGFSVLALETARALPARLDSKIQESLLHVGIAFLVAFLSRFVTVHLQIDPVWHGLSLRWITELLAILTFFYWMAFYPNKTEFSPITQLMRERLIEGCLGFITLCVIAEIPEVWRPCIWMVMALVLLVGTLRYHWPRRLSLYAWMYLIASIVHLAFVTSTLTMPSLFVFEQYHLPALVAIVLQFGFAILIFANQGEIKDKIVYSQPSMTVLLPIFLGIALLFGFNYEKAILTLLWVGLTALYLAIGLLIQSKRSFQIAIGALVLCSIRLLVFDLVQSDLSARALVFIGVGILMLGLSALYKKYKYRIEVHEAI